MLTITGDAQNDLEGMFMSGSATVGHAFITHWMPLPAPPEKDKQ